LHHVENEKNVKKLHATICNDQLHMKLIWIFSPKTKPYFATRVITFPNTLKLGTFQWNWQSNSISTIINGKQLIQANTSTNQGNTNKGQSHKVSFLNHVNDNIVHKWISHYEGKSYWESLYYIISINIDVNDNITYLPNINSNLKKNQTCFLYFWQVMYYNLNQSSWTSQFKY
jgi:hypothetical protein